MLNTPHQFISNRLQQEGVKEDIFIKFINAKFKNSFKRLEDLDEKECQNVIDSFDTLIAWLHREPLLTFTAK